MIKTQLPSYPMAELPANMDIRDFDLENGKYARVVLELSTTVENSHFIMYCQVYEMNADGSFVAAPHGYPSRTKTSTHTLPESALGDTIEMDDAWVRFTGDYSFLNNPEIPIQTSKPSEPGTAYGDMVFDSVAGHCWVWAEGFADIVARAKVTEMSNIMHTSMIRSGSAFRR